MKLKNKLEQLPNSWYFLGVVIVVFFLFSIFNQEIYFKSLDFFSQIIYKIIPIFILVFILMSLTNYFITPKTIMKHMKDPGMKKWFFVVIGGILSSGPIYMWYPLLADLKNKGLNYGLISCFLYNRAIKIPLLPLAIIYFSWKYIIILMAVMICASVIQGIFINKLMEVKNENSNSIGR